MNIGWLVLLLLLPLVGSCSLRMYGNLKCEGPCELTLEREAGELDVIPDPIPLPESSPPKGK
jgi:hypothetical protein